MQALEEEMPLHLARFTSSGMKCAIANHSTTRMYQHYGMICATVLDTALGTIRTVAITSVNMQGKDMGVYTVNVNKC